MPMNPLQDLMNRLNQPSKDWEYPVTHPDVVALMQSCREELKRKPKTTFDQAQQMFCRVVLDRLKHLESVPRKLLTSWRIGQRLDPVDRLLDA